MPAAALAECLGLHVLGQCVYDPRNPSLAYFTLGDVVAALSITLLIPQFLKPIYRFRLRVNGLSMTRLYILVFTSAFFVLIATLIPHFPRLALGGPLSYPVFWEALGASTFAVAYAALAYASVRPAKVKPGRVEFFVRGAAGLLANATEADHIDFADEVGLNIAALGRMAAFGQWPHERSAFYDFTNRNRINDAGYAHALLRLISDPGFCGTLISRAPWTAGAIVKEVTQTSSYIDAAKPFISELARQAIVHPQSTMVREIEFDGFNAAPVLMNSLFSDIKIIRHYEPFARLEFRGIKDPDEPSIKRLNEAAQEALEVILDNSAYWQARSFATIAHVYQGILTDVIIGKHSRPHGSPHYLVWFALRKIIRTTREHLAKLPPKDRSSFYQVGGSPYDNHVFSDVANLAFEALSLIANEFDGPGEEYWHEGRSILDEIFPMIGNEPVGMDPLQQRVALRIEENIKDNMIGFYPAFTRLLLSVLGPHATNYQQGQTASRILRDNFYLVLQGNLGTLFTQQPTKAPDFLPKSVTFDLPTLVLTHHFRDGATSDTALSTLQLTANSLDKAAVAY